MNETDNFKVKPGETQAARALPAERPDAPARAFTRGVAPLRLFTFAMLAAARRITAVYVLLSACIVFASFQARAECAEFDGAFDGFAGAYTGKKHSMADPAAYAGIKALSGIVRGAAEGRYEKVFVIEGGEETARKYLAACGASGVRSVKSANSRGEEWSYLEARTGGRTWAADHSSFGEDQCRHLLLCYRFAGVPAGMLKGVVRDGSHEKIREGFSSMIAVAGPARYGVIGYRRSLLRHLHWRINTLEKAKALSKKLRAIGSPSRAAIALKLELLTGAGYRGYRRLRSDMRAAADLFDSVAGPLPLDRFFLRSDEYYRMAEAEKAIGNIRKAIGEKRAGFIDGIYSLTSSEIRFAPYSGKAGEYFGLPFDIRRVTFLDGRGLENRILICEHPYGRNAGAMADAMAGAGVERIFFYGSAGCLFDAPKYSLLIPEKIATPSGMATNAILPDEPPDRPTPGHAVRRSAPPAELAASIRTALHRSVFSPLAETDEMIEGLRAGGTGSIDVEAAHVFEATAKAGIPAAAIFIASDFPGTRTTLEEWERESEEYIRAQMRALDLLIGAMNIREIVLK